MVTSLYSEPIPVTEIKSDWRKFHFPRDSRVITCVNLNLVVVSSNFVCGALAFRFILSFSFRPFPPALCVRLQLQCSSPWTMVVRIQTSSKCY